MDWTVRDVADHRHVAHGHVLVDPERLAPERLKRVRDQNLPRVTRPSPTARIWKQWTRGQASTSEIAVETLQYVAVRRSYNAKRRDGIRGAPCGSSPVRSGRRAISRTADSVGTLDRLGISAPIHAGRVGFE